MATYHFTKSICSRKSGGNVVLFVAYIRREKRQCLRTGETKDFSQKKDLVYKAVILPDNAPDWAVKLLHSQIKTKDGYAPDTQGNNLSEYAWNQIGLMEKRVDAQLAEHFEFSLPRELTQEQNIELVNSFVKNVMAQDGYFVDVSIHWDENNPHAHLARPLRRLNETGFAQKYKKGEISQDYYLNKKNNLKTLRESWGAYANLKLKECGHDVSIDHRSHKDRGLELIPTHKEGKARYFGDGFDVREQRKAENEIIRAANAKLIDSKPQILVDKLAQERTEFSSDDIKAERAKYVVNQSVQTLINDSDTDGLLSSDVGERTAWLDRQVETIIKAVESDHAIFSDRTLYREVMTHSEQKDNEQDFNLLLDRIKSTDRFINLGLGDDGRVHFTTRDAFKKECEVIDITERMAERNRFAIDKLKLRSTIKRYGLNPSQARALEHLISGKDLSMVTGHAGTGKTYILKAAREIWEREGYTVHGVALQGSAAQAMQRDTGIESSTIYSFRNSVKTGHKVLGEKDIVVMDEGAMTGLDDMHCVLDILKQDAKLCGLGDKMQTQPVGRGSPFGAMLEVAGCAVMNDVLRQKVAWQREATVALETGESSKVMDALKAYDDHGCVHFLDDDDKTHAFVVEKWSDGLEKTLDLTQNRVMVAYKNDTVKALNTLARDRLLQLGYLDGKHIQVKTKDDVLDLTVGDRIVFNRNDYKVGVRNGQFASVLKVHKNGVIDVQIDGDAKVSIDTKAYKHLAYGYAATIHKVQGATFDGATACIDSPGFDLHLFLVAASRHRHTLNIVTSKNHFEDIKQLGHTLSRNGIKDHILNYPAGFAVRRGLSPEGVLKKAAAFVSRRVDSIHDSLLYLNNYQAYLNNKTARIAQDQQEDYKLLEMKYRRQTAVIVANFADNRQKIGKLMSEVMALSEQDNQQTHELKSSVFQLQIENSQLAVKIADKAELQKLALDRNRINYRVIEKSLAFGERLARVEGLAETFNKGKVLDVEQSWEVITDLKSHYGMLLHVISDKKERTALIDAINTQALVKRRNLALDAYPEQRQIINQVRDYLKEDLAFKAACRKLGDKKPTDKDYKVLDSLSISRDSLAEDIVSFGKEHADLFESINVHFDVSKERLDQHRARHERTLTVENFATLSTSSAGAPNWKKQLIAQRIKADAKAYAPMVNRLLPDAFKSVNLENWHYERNIKLSQSSKEFQSTVQNVRDYFEASKTAKVAWEKVIARRGKSSNYWQFVKRAQGLSYRRDLIAQSIVKNLEQHTGAISFENARIEPLVQRARACDFLDRYQKETARPRKLQMAHFMSDNFKSYGAGLAVMGLSQQVREDSRYHHYLRTVQTSPNQMTRDCIRLAESYNRKRIEAGVAYGQFKALKRVGQEREQAQIHARHSGMQRNKAAYDFITGALKHGLIEPEMKGLDLDYTKLKRFADQHLAYLKIIKYKNGKGYERGLIAKQLLQDKSCYHMIFEHGLNFKLLSSDAKEYRLYQQEHANKPLVEDSTVTQRQNPEKISNNITTLWDHDKLNQECLKQAYFDMLGAPESIDKGSMFIAGYTIITDGQDKGKWTSTKHNGELKDAVELVKEQHKVMGLAANRLTCDLAGLHPDEVKKDINLDHLRIQSAQSMFEGTKPIQGTLGERYLHETRGISKETIDRSSVTFLPPMTPYLDNNATKGILEEKVGKLPAVVIPVINPDGELAAIQRVYLDKYKPIKNTFLDDPKLSKGIVKGSAGIIQRGTDGLVFITEGPETGLSIAQVNPNSTVLAALSVSNIAEMIPFLKTLDAKQIIIGGDNDGITKAAFTKTEEAVQKLNNAGLNAISIYPKAIKELDKTDFNDTLQKQGADTLKEGIQNAMSAQSIISDSLISKLIAQAKQIKGSDASKKAIDEIKTIMALYKTHQIDAPTVLKEIKSQSLLKEVMPNLSKIIQSTQQGLSKTVEPGRLNKGGEDKTIDKPPYWDKLTEQQQEILSAPGWSKLNSMTGPDVDEHIHSLNDIHRNMLHRIKNDDLKQIEQQTQYLMRRWDMIKQAPTVANQIKSVAPDLVKTLDRYHLKWVRTNPKQERSRGHKLGL